MNGLSEASVLFPAWSRGAWCDCDQQPLPGRVCSGEDLLSAFVQASPRWVDALLRWRDWLVAPLGLKVAAAPLSTLMPGQRWTVGDRLGIFRLLHLDGREAVLGEDDRHLDFRLSLMHQDGMLRVVTLVRTHNLAGRVYLRLVTPFHHLIAGVMIRRMREHLLAPLV